MDIFIVYYWKITTKGITKYECIHKTIKLCFLAKSNIVFQFDCQIKP